MAIRISILFREQTKITLLNSIKKWDEKKMKTLSKEEYIIV